MIETTYWAETKEILPHEASNPKSLSFSFFLSLSQRFPLIRGKFYVYDFFSTPSFFIIFWVGLPTYDSNHSPILREHIFVGFNDFLLSHVGALSSIVIGQKGLLILSDMGFYMCAV